MYCDQASRQNLLAQKRVSCCHSNLTKSLMEFPSKVHRPLLATFASLRAVTEHVHKQPDATRFCFPSHCVGIGFKTSVSKSSRILP